MHVQMHAKRFGNCHVSTTATINPESSHQAAFHRFAKNGIHDWNQSDNK